MAVDTTIPLGEPGVASFQEEIFGGPNEIRFGDGATPTTNITLTAAGADVTLALGSVIDAQGGGLLADQAGITKPENANYILAEPIFIANGDTMVVPVYRAGHFNQEALTWDASFTTDAQKKAAFEGSLSPTIFISKPEHLDSAIFT